MKQYRVVTHWSNGYNERTWDGGYGNFAWFDNLKGAEKALEDEIKLSVGLGRIEWEVRLEVVRWWNYIFPRASGDIIKIVHGYGKEVEA